MLFQTHSKPQETLQECYYHYLIHSVSTGIEIKGMLHHVEVFPTPKILLKLIIRFSVKTILDVRK